MDDQLPFQLVLTLFTVVGVGVGVALLVGLASSARRTRAASSWAKVAAVVVDNQTHSYTDQRLSFSPVVRYRDAGGTERTAAAQDTSSSSWVLGTDVEVLVDPNQIGTVLLAGPRAGRERRFGARFATVVALFFVAFGVLAWVGFGSTVADGPWWAGPFGHAPDGFQDGFPDTFDPGS